MTFENLQALGMGIIGFAIIIGVGTIVLHQFGGSVSDCGVRYPANVTVTKCVWNTTQDTCVSGNDSAHGCGDPASSGWTSNNYMIGQLGSSGLAGWTPAIVAISVGMLFLGYFMVKGGRKR